ncbi:major facilitator superfamily MFS_1 [Glaciecola sp. 4H-3-7+YE-5]|jgi:predicted MFS family arabinose efflux permease|uniref:Major facilitator superfamily (MFS_1) transporter n=1 Tax=Paraglaciecola agarilytica NO2 TaxID=1125747 RepID=A0ABQ0I9B9_9ALTE|nr:MFS transporter [Paraglaciecola agarilytica]AEE25169.1 major facilitator superfamily MFS_1 [Glaciecola sp. 4H-3-7+YE-5]GAC05906.1 major facilitator superfamily (MFS_1) transporter [Paraglaciecola agarilytica NO2]
MQSIRPVQSLQTKQAIAQPSVLSTRQLFLFAFAIAATVANLYYVQPLLPEIKNSFVLSGLESSLLGSFTQLGYAAALLFISPLGDIFPRKNVVRVLSCTLVVGSLLVGFIEYNIALLLGLFCIGVSANITQQIIPLAASLSIPSDRGRVVGTLMTGLTAGILISRAISGFIAQHYEWRAVFIYAAVIAACIGLLLNARLPLNQPAAKLAYPALLRSMLTLFKQHKLLRVASITGALWFAAFNALWVTVAIHVMDEPLSFSVQQAGLLGFIGLSGIVGAKVSGRLVTKLGASRLISIAIGLTIAGFAVLMLFGASIWGLVFGIILIDIGVFAAQVPNQVSVFSIDPAAQSRINAVYMLMYYTGASLGAAGAMYLVNHINWQAVIYFAMGLSVLALTHHRFQAKHY